MSEIEQPIEQTDGESQVSSAVVENQPAQPTPVAEIERPKSAHDIIRAKIAESEQKGKEPPGKEPAVPPADTEDQEPEEPVAAQDNRKADKPKAAADKIAPPAHFSGDAKVNWARLPPAVQKAIVEKEEQRAALERAAAPVLEAVKPRANVLAQRYGSVDKGISTLLQLQEFAERSPAEFIQWFAQENGLLQGGNQGQPQPEFSPQNLYAEIDRATRVALARTQAEAAISGMQFDYERFPYFDELRGTMSLLVQAGKANSLQEAYEKAALLEGKTTQASAPSAAPSQAEKVKAAKQRAKSVSGAPVNGAAPALANKSRSTAEIIRELMAG